MTKICANYYYFLWSLCLVLHSCAVRLAVKVNPNIAFQIRPEEDISYVCSFAGRVGVQTLQSTLNHQCFFIRSSWNTCKLLVSIWSSSSEPLHSSFNTLSVATLSLDYQLCKAGNCPEDQWKLGSSFGPEHIAARDATLPHFRQNTSLLLTRPLLSEEYALSVIKGRLFSLIKS